MSLSFSGGNGRGSEEKIGRSGEREPFEENYLLGLNLSTWQLHNFEGDLLPKMGDGVALFAKKKRR